MCHVPSRSYVHFIDITHCLLTQLSEQLCESVHQSNESLAQTEVQQTDNGSAYEENDNNHKGALFGLIPREPRYLVEFALVNAQCLYDLFAELNCKNSANNNQNRTNDDPDDCGGGNTLRLIVCVFVLVSGRRTCCRNLRRSR